MINLVEVLNYRSLRDTSIKLKPFNVLVGPNASGKTTLLDVISFLGQFVSDGPQSAVTERTSNFQDLVWKRQGNKFEIAIEATIPSRLRNLIARHDFESVRYEVGIKSSRKSDRLEIFHEKVLLKSENKRQNSLDQTQLRLFPYESGQRTTILTTHSSPKLKLIINKKLGGNDNFYKETEKGYNPSIKLGPQKSALGNLPFDEELFPVSSWLKDLLINGVQKFILNSQIIRKPSPPGKGMKFNTDGSNLPWIIDNLKVSYAKKFDSWIEHLKTALIDIETIKIKEREEDKHKYIIIKYKDGLEAPSWIISDGTLRMLALTLPAYLPDFTGIYLIEEPENGIHPGAVETIIQSLSSVYNAQILLATHSNVILNMVELDDILCFAKNSNGATNIVSGSSHPKLKDWRGDTNLGSLFATGILG